MIKLKIYESYEDLATFDKDWDFIEAVFTQARPGHFGIEIPLDRYDDRTRKNIVSDIRKLVKAQDGMTVKETIIEEYNDISPDDELFDWVSDVLYDIEDKAHDSKYENFADTASLLIRGTHFYW